MILGDFERVAALLAQATELDHQSADLAYRRASILEDLDDIDGAMREFCRSVALGVESVGIFDADLRLDSLSELVRLRIPEVAQEWFREGLIQTDDSLYTEAIASFTGAIDEAPEWAIPLYNRAIVYEHVGLVQEGLADFRTYLTYLTVDPETAYAIIVSERIGLLEGAASVVPPSPVGALVLGVVPGMGHYYTARPKAGTLTLAAAGGAVVAGFMFKNITTVCLTDVPEGQPCPPDLVVDELTERPYKLYGIVIGVAVTIAGAVEAMLKAKRRRTTAEAIATPPDVTGPQIGLPTVSVRGLRVDFNLFRVTFR